MGVQIWPHWNPGWAFRILSKHWSVLWQGKPFLRQVDWPISLHQVCGRFGAGIHWVFCTVQFHLRWDKRAQIRFCSSCSDNKTFRETFEHSSIVRLHKYTSLCHNLFPFFYNKHWFLKCPYCFMVPVLNRLLWLSSYTIQIVIRPAVHQGFDFTVLL